MQKDNITLLCHRRPDGDTVGSAFALYYALRELGKEVRVLCADALPKQYDYLYGDYTPSRVLDWPVEYVVTVDVATGRDGWAAWRKSTAIWWISALTTTPATAIMPPRPACGRRPGPVPSRSPPSLRPSGCPFPAK